MFDLKKLDEQDVRARLPASPALFTIRAGRTSYAGHRRGMDSSLRSPFHRNERNSGTLAVTGDGGLLEKQRGTPYCCSCCLDCSCSGWRNGSCLDCCCSRNRRAGHAPIRLRPLEDMYCLQACEAYSFSAARNRSFLKKFDSCAYSATL